MKILLKSLLAFFRHDGTIYAGSITTFFLMSFVPFCLLLFSVFGYFLTENKELYNFVVQHFEGFFPQATEQIAGMLSSIIVYRKLGAFTAILYFYFSYQLYVALETAVNNIFGITSRRSLFVSVFLSLVFITLVIVFVVISFAITSAMSAPVFVESLFARLGINKIVTLLIGNIITVIIAFAAISLLYMILPKKRVHLKHALWGGAFTSILLEAAKYLFTFYMVTQSANYGVIYGPLTSFVVFLLWIIYASSIFLIGAALVHNLEEQSERHV
jgi:membrane protein